MKRSHIGAQFGWYLVVGGVAFWVDIGAFVVLYQLWLPVLAASMTSFILATLVNYYLCYRLAFTRGRYSRLAEIARLFVVAVIGLGLNSLCVWALVSHLPMPPVVAKVLAVPVVLGWNFLGKRQIVFWPQLPPTTYKLTKSLVNSRQRRKRLEPDVQTPETRGGIADEQSAL